jgi:hypothetical protein
VNGPSARAGGLDDAAGRLKVSAHIRTGNRAKPQISDPQPKPDPSRVLSQASAATCRPHRPGVVIIHEIFGLDDSCVATPTPRWSAATSPARWPTFSNFVMPPPNTDDANLVDLPLSALLLAPRRHPGQVIGAVPGDRRARRVQGSELGGGQGDRQRAKVLLDA